MRGIRVDTRATQVQVNMSGYGCVCPLSSCDNSSSSWIGKAWLLHWVTRSKVSIQTTPPLPYKTIKVSVNCTSSACILTVAT